LYAENKGGGGGNSGKSRWRRSYLLDVILSKILAVVAEVEVLEVVHQVVLWWWRLWWRGFMEVDSLVRIYGG
jgi:predicted amidophosphoribosyltransferase